MRALVFVLLQGLLVTSAFAAETVHLKDRLRPLQAPASQPAVQATAVSAPTQVIDLRSATSAAGAVPEPSGGQVAMARTAGPDKGRALSRNQLTAALTEARVALATANVYALLTPGRLVDDRAIVRMLGPGPHDITPDAVAFWFGARQSGENSYEHVGVVNVETFLRDAGVYLVDYTYSYAGMSSAACTVRTGSISQSAYLHSWQTGEDASHLVVAVNYTTPPPWPNPSSTYQAIQLYCDLERSTGSFRLYSINVTKP
jgi:hypothetical protein